LWRGKRGRRRRCCGRRRDQAQARWHRKVAKREYREHAFHDRYYGLAGTIRSTRQGGTVGDDDDDASRTSSLSLSPRILQRHGGEQQQQHEQQWSCEYLPQRHFGRAEFRIEFAHGRRLRYQQQQHQCQLEDEYVQGCGKDGKHVSQEQEDRETKGDGGTGTGGTPWCCRTGVAKPGVAREQRIVIATNRHCRKDSDGNPNRRSTCRGNDPNRRRVRGRNAPRILPDHSAWWRQIPWWLFHPRSGKIYSSAGVPTM